MSISQIETLYSEAVAAMDAADFATAILKLMALKLRLATTLNVTHRIAAGGTEQILVSPAGEIDSLISECRKMQASVAAASVVSGISGPFGQTKVRYARATR